jgi:probable HAF family extracellular repeat protein
MRSLGAARLPALATGTSLLLAVLVLSAGHASAAPPRWTFKELGAFFNVVEAIPSYSVNDQGRVAGWGVQGFFGGSPQGPFLTQPNSVVNWSSRPGDPPVNPTLFVDQVVNGMFNNTTWNPNTDQTLRPRQPYAVNNNGVTTGLGDSYPHAMAFLGTTTQTTAIGPTGAVCVGYAINDANVVAGVKTDVSHAVRIAGGVTTDLGTWSTTWSGQSSATGINSSGTIVGSATNDVFVGPNYAYRPFRWTEATGLQDLGTYSGGVSGNAYDINSSGAVTGFSEDPTNVTGRAAVMWSPTNALTTIPSFGPGYTNITGRWITDAGWVVGPAYGAKYFFYQDGQTYDLATLLDDDGLHWTDIVITDMNNSGQMVGYGINDHSGTGARAAFLLSPNTVTPVALALVDAEATTERVRLRWHSSSHELHATLQRRGEHDEWSYRADVRSDGSGMIQFEDTEIVAGRKYGYRLEVAGNGPSEYFGESWVDVPTGLSLAIRGFHPNPSVGSPVVVSALPNTGPARLEIFDVTGRRVALREWSSLEGGAHTIPLAGETRFSPGVYGLRITFAGRTVSVNGVILAP